MGQGVARVRDTRTTGTDAFHCARRKPLIALQHCHRESDGIGTRCFNEEYKSVSLRSNRRATHQQTALIFFLTNVVKPMRKESEIEENDAKIRGQFSLITELKLSDRHRQELSNAF